MHINFLRRNACAGRDCSFNWKRRRRLRQRPRGVDNRTVQDRNSFQEQSVSARAIKAIDDIEFATMEWVDWFNTRRLHGTLDYVTPDEFEAIYYSQLSILQPEMSPA
ncbi:integrase core domain-containing protein [Rhodococcus qingshengii]|uniref:integrase core domain-containing protein n=1 Tax=Rhodococcus qingshengii TaxID=334542 RepID=UPI003AFA6748